MTTQSIEYLASNVRVQHIGQRMFNAAYNASASGDEEAVQIANINLLNAYMTAGLVIPDCKDRARRTVENLISQIEIEDAA